MAESNSAQKEESFAPKTPEEAPPQPDVKPAPGHTADVSGWYVTVDATGGNDVPHKTETGTIDPAGVAHPDNPQPRVY